MIATILGRLAPETWIWKHITSAVDGVSKIIMRALYKGMLFSLPGRTMECFETEERSSLLIANYSLVQMHHMYVSTKCRAVGHAVIYMYQLCQVDRSLRFGPCGSVPAVPLQMQSVQLPRS